MSWSKENPRQPQARPGQIVAIERTRLINNAESLPANPNGWLAGWIGPPRPAQLWQERDMPRGLLGGPNLKALIAMDQDAQAFGGVRSRVGGKGPIGVAARLAADAQVGAASLPPMIDGEEGLFSIMVVDLH